MLSVASEFTFLGFTLQDWKTLTELASFFVGAVVASLAFKTYRDNSQRERAKWNLQLFEKFFEDDRYKDMREKLDSEQGGADIQKLVVDEPPEFTDYLNFFEFVAFLAESKQLSKDDVLKLFHYYLRCLKHQKAVMTYLNNKDNGFEQLREFFRTTKL